MTHEQRRNRRKQIAEYARTHTDAVTARRFGVTATTARQSRRENGVVKAHGVPTSTYRIIAALIRSEKQADIARRECCSRQFVNQVKAKMEKNGIFEAVLRFSAKDLDAYLADREMEQ